MTGRSINGQRHVRGGRSSTTADPPQVANVLANQLSDLALSLEEEVEGVDSTLTAIVHAAVATIPGAEHASISAVKGRREVETLAATGDLPRAVDRAQYQAGQGPCLDTLYEHSTVRVVDVTTEHRWPLWAAQAASLGAGSVLAVLLYVQGRDLAALNVMSSAPGALDEEAEEVALLFAPHAAVAMSSAATQEGLRTALDRRDLIGMAKGVLIERYKIPSDRAFMVLARHSQNSNRKLHDIAEEVILAARAGTAVLPPVETGSPTLSHQV